MEIKEHNFRTVSQEEAQNMSEGIIDQTEHCRKCMMRLKYFNERGQPACDR